MLKEVTEVNFIIRKRKKKKSSRSFMKKVFPRTSWGLYGDDLNFKLNVSLETSCITRLSQISSNISSIFITFCTTTTLQQINASHVLAHNFQNWNFSFQLAFDKKKLKLLLFYYISIFFSHIVKTDENISRNT